MVIFRKSYLCHINTNGDKHKMKLNFELHKPLFRMGEKGKHYRICPKYNLKTMEIDGNKLEFTRDTVSWRHVVTLDSTKLKHINTKNREIRK